MQKLRQAIAADGQKLAKIVRAPAFQKTFGKLEGEMLKTMPRDYPADHLFAEYLRHKSFTVGVTEQASSIPDDNLAGHIAGIFKQAYPLVSFLRDSLAP